MAQDVQGMLVRIEATTAQLRREMENADKAVGKATKSMDGQLSRADRAFDRLNRSSAGALGEIGKNFDLLSLSVKAATATMAAFGVGASFTRFIANTQNAEKEQAQLAAVLRSTGEAAGYSASQLNDMASRMAKSTTYAAGAVTTAQTAMLAFTGIVGDEFTRAMDSAANMSARTGMSLTQTAELIGRALDVPSQGMASLSRQGFRFSEDQRELMKQLEATGKTAEAQGIILAALEESYGGAAAAARDTLAGALTALTNTFDDLLTGSDNALSGVTKAVNAVNAALSKPEARMAISALGDALIAVSAIMAGRVVAAGASAAGAFLAAQVQALRYQAALASMAGVSRNAAIAMTASATAARTASAAMALLGGPVGAAVVAASAVGYFATRSSEAEREADALDARIQKLDGSFQSLSANQAAAAILDYETKLSSANMTAEAAAAKVFTLNDNISRFPGSPKQEQWREELIRANAALDTANQVVDGHREKITQLTAVIDQNTTSRQGNNLANLEGIEAGEKYLKQLETQLNRMKDKTAVQAAERVITENQIDRESELAKKILATAAAQDAQREADAKLTEGIETGNKALDDRIKAIDALRDKYNPAAKAQADYDAAIKLADESLKDGTYTTEEYQKVVQGLWTDLNKPIWDKHNKAVDEAKAKLKQLDDQLDAVRDRLDPVRAATKRLTDEKKLLKEGLDAGSMSLEEYQLRLRQLDDEYARNQKSTSQWTEWTESALERVDSAFADAWRNIGDGFSSFRDSLTNAFKQMLAELAHLAITRPIVMQIGAALGIGGAAGQATAMMGGGSGGGIGVGSLLQYGQTAYSVITGVGPAALAGYQSGGILGGIQGVTGYYGDMFSGAYNSISGALGYGNGANIAGYTGQAYANWAAGGSQALGASQAGYTGAQYSSWVAQQNAGATAGAYAPWVSAAAGAYMGYQNAGVKGAVAGGLGGWGGAKAGAAMGSYFGPIGTAVGAVLGGILGSIGGSKVFGGDWQTKDVGLTAEVANGGFGSFAFERQKKKGGWFGSNKKRTIYTPIEQEINQTLNDTYDAVEGGIIDLFEQLGLDVSDAALAGINIARTEISTKGKTEEEISAAISEWFAGAGEAINTQLNAALSTGLDYDLAGMQAFVGNLQGVNALFEQLNYELYESTVAGGRMAEQLSAVAGGFDVLAANVSTYYDAFYTGAEKTANVVESITQAFEDAEVALAGNRAEYRAMVDNIDRTTEAGREMFATLMALSGQAATYYSILEAQLMGAVDSSFAAVQRAAAAQRKTLTDAYNARIGSINDMAATAASSLAGITGVATSLDAALKRLRGTSDDAVRMLRAQAVMTLNSALVTARAGGSLAGFEGLQDALDVASEMDASLYGSLEDFEREQGRTANLVAQLEKVNGKQLSTEGNILKTLQEQLREERQQFDEEMGRLDEQLAYAQSQLDALNGVDNSVLSVVDAINAMNSSVVAALSLMGGKAGQNATPANVGTLVESVYRSVLGRDADAGGLAYWQNDVATGAIRLDQLEEAIRNAARANGEIPAFASGGFHAGGLRLVGERGPELEVTGPSRIYNASQTAAMLGGAGSTEELRALRSEVAGLRSALGAIAKYTESTAYGVRQMNEIGLPQGEAA